MNWPLDRLCIFSILLLLTITSGVSGATDEPLVADLIGYGRVELTVKSDQGGAG